MQITGRIGCSLFDGGGVVKRHNRLPGSTARQQRSQLGDRRDQIHQPEP
jgi:hypothetical protein